METKVKKNYTKPILMSEVFVPQEYVAVCPPVNGVTEYELACNGGEDVILQHSNNGCKRSDAYTISIDEQGYIKSIYEIPSDLYNGGYAQNITVNGSPASTTPLTDLNGTYNLKWETKSYDGTYIDIVFHHTGELRLSTAVNVNLS